MSTEYFLLSLAVVFGTGLYGLGVYLLTTRHHRRFVAEHRPHTPAE